MLKPVGISSDGLIVVYNITPGIDDEITYAFNYDKELSQHKSKIEYVKDELNESNEDLVPAFKTGNGYYQLNEIMKVK